MIAGINPVELRQVVRARVVTMPEHEDRYWAAVDAALMDRGWAARLLDTAVEWIGSGLADVHDPYQLALSWACP